MENTLNSADEVAALKAEALRALPLTPSAELQEETGDE